MAVAVDTTSGPPLGTSNWYAQSAVAVVAAFGVDLSAGQPAARAAELLAANGPSALPEEWPRPGWQRFLDQYRSYMQIILCGAAVVSFLVKEWSTAVRATVEMERLEGEAYRVMAAASRDLDAATFDADGDLLGYVTHLDRETPGLMTRRPQPRGQTVLTQSVLLTVGLVGLAMTVALLALIQFGKSHFGSVEIGQSIAFTAFAFMLIVAAFECRSETETVFTTASFDSRQMNVAALGEFILAVLTTQMDALRRILGTTDLTMDEFRWALIPPVVLLGLWELGKLIARRQRAHVGS